MLCPKCGRAVEDGAFICPGCDFILDASFLGDDITDDDAAKRPAARAPSRAFGKKPKEGQPDFGEDAMILGDVGGDDDAVSSFQSNDAGVSQREVTQARFYIGGAVAQLMNPDAIPEIATGSAGQSMRVTPFERHVLGFVNGKRSVGRIQKKAAMEESEFKTALALLADKGFVRLKGYKKQKDGAGPPAAIPRSGAGSTASNSGPPARSASSASSSGSASSPAARRAVAAPEGERTMVASMEHIEALARAPQALPSLMRSRADGDVELASGALKRPPSRAQPPMADDVVDDTPVMPRAAASAIARAAAVDDAPDVAPAVGKSNARFASLKAQEPVHDDDWGKVDNSSSVFAESGPAPAARPPSLVDRAAEDEAPAELGDDEELPAEVAAEADGFDDGEALTRGRGSLASALKDPTGMGDSLLPDNDGPGDGAPLDDDDDADDDDDSGAFAAADDDDDDGALPAPAEAFDDDDDDSVSNDPLGPPRRIHDEVTRAPPQPDVASLPTGPAPVNSPVVEEPDEAFAPPTAVLPVSRPFTLPSDALMPLPEPEPVKPTPPAPVVVVVKAEPAKVEPARPMPLPGQALVTAPPAVMALPGQALVTSSPAGGRPGPTAAPPRGPPPAPRPSASSSIPFELRKKAERIYEQALKDQAEGRTASALMNAKLAMNFDPSVPAYKELFDGLGTAQKGKPVVKGPQSRELILFEQASEAEGKGDYPKAVKLLEEAIAVNPKAAALYNRLGVVLSIRLKRHDEALAHLKRAIELEPGSIVYMNNFSKVTGLLESVLEKDPKARKKKGQADDQKVEIKKMRPVKF
ncbi:MAG: tetratricopeptide repeat protein [Deltaproteobacteria bacterium]|nr:tetratricopeptide repeat protein [Deltaproteobacteria bacterium]